MCYGQDSTMSLSRSSVSFTGGANICYPDVSSIPGTPWGGPGRVGVGPLISLSYNYSFHSPGYIPLGLKLGLGFAQYNFIFPWEISYGDQQMNEAEAYVGLYANVKFSRKTGWYNELDLFWSGAINGSDYWISWSNLPYGNYSNLFLMYQSGVSIYISRKVTVTPLVAFPVISFTALYNSVRTNANQSFYCANAFSSLRTVIMVTYNFGKK